MFERMTEGEDVFGMPTSPDAPSFAEMTAARDAAYAAEVARQRVPSASAAALVDAVDDVLALVPADLPGPQALADAALLLEQVERLRGGLLGRIADVERRKLYVLDGAASVTSWVDAQQTSLDRGQVALSRRLSALPTLERQCATGSCRMPAPSWSARP